jgi:hypothetical protein
MATILCQACKQPMDVPAEMGGQTMACPHCGQQFVAPRGPAPRTPPPTRVASPLPQMPPPQSPSPASPPMFQPAATPPTPPSPAFAPMIDEPLKPSGRIRERPVTLLDVFDLTFARFVTPIIVKIVWVIVLIFTGLWLLLLTFLLVIGLVGSSGVGMSTFGAAPSLGTESRLVAALIQLVLYFFEVAATGAVLLFWRLMLESIMILFSISNSLKSIDRKTRAD